ncbi:MAG: ATP-binding protein [Trichodesmium sp.]
MKFYQRKIPLYLILTTQFAAQVIAIVSLVGYLSYRTGQKSVKQLADQLMGEQGSRIVQHLDSYLGKAQEINLTNLEAVKTGVLDLNDFETLGKYFYKQIQLFDFAFINFGGEDGSFIGSGYVSGKEAIIAEMPRNNIGVVTRYSVDDQGNRNEVLKVIENTKRNNMSWYIEALKAGKPIWSSIYNWTDVSNIISIAASAPVYDEQQNFLGVLVVDLELNQLSQFLQQLKGDRSGRIFIMERSGLIVATSGDESPAPIIDGKATRLNALNSENSLIRDVTQHLKQRYGNLQEITKLQFLHPQLPESPFVQVRPYRDRYGLDWLIVNVVPESEFLAEIHANVRRSVALCILALMGAIASGIWTSRRITRSLSGLTQATQELASGKLDQPLKSTRIREVENLSQSFGLMVKSLRQAEKLRQNYQQDLEQEVTEKTKSLQIALKELIIAKQKAEVANQAKSSFIANMSHELRTPLNAVLGFSQIMMRSQNLSKEDKENTTIIHKSGSYLLTLINNILDLSKIEAGKMIINGNSFDFYSFLNELEDLLHLTAKNKGLTLIFDHEDNVPQYIYTDETKLRQVLINLINNGIKFTTEGGVSLTVGTTQKESSLNSPCESQKESSLNSPCERGEINEVRSCFSNGDLSNEISPLISPFSQGESHKKATIIFEVRDTGAGIAEEEMSKLFEAFAQTETGKNSQEGTGLGLPISRKFVNLMGGDITVKSQVGKGTTFRFDIQVEVVNQQDIEIPEKPRHVIGLQPNQPHYKILIVDDRPTNRLLLIKLLQPLGLKLKEATNGKEAVDIWEKWEPHLIWMDMRMPVMDGYEATQHIKGTTKGNATAIIALTASVLEEQKAIILSAGCDDFVRKPFREATIFETMKKHLGIEYIYEEEMPSPTPTELSSLTVEDLQEMPTEWLEKVYFAAKALDDDMMEKLIEQIPFDNSLLAEKLTTLVNYFQFKTIRQLIESLNQEKP